MKWRPLICLRSKSSGPPLAVRAKKSVGLGGDEHHLEKASGKGRGTWTRWDQQLVRA